MRASALKPGDLGNWCFIVPAGTANSVSIENTGDTELVALRTFGPDHPTMPVLPWQDRSKLVPNPYRRIFNDKRQNRPARPA